MTSLKVSDAVTPNDSFDVATTGIETSCSEDSDMAQYSRRRRKKGSGSSDKVLQTAGFAVFSQCLNSGVVNSGSAFTDLVRMTKSMLSPPWSTTHGSTAISSAVHDVTEAVENVEMREEEILRHDYDLERV